MKQKVLKSIREERADEECTVINGVKIDRALNVQDVQIATGMKRYEATDICKRFGFLLPKSWCISENVLNRLIETGAKSYKDYMKLSQINLLSPNTRWTRPTARPTPKKKT